MSRKQRRAAVQHKQNRPVASTPTVPTQNLTGGPRTPEAKAISAQNAFSHGLTAARIVLPWENQSEFDSLLDQLVAEHRPATATEGILVREIAEQYWRLQRTRNHEHTLLSKANEFIEEEPNHLAALEAWDKQGKLIQRYATRHERAFHKCLSTLRTLQKERRAAETEAAAESKTEAKVEATAPASQSEEFVSQNSENPSIPAQFVPECPSALPSSLPIPDPAPLVRSAF